MAGPRSSIAGRRRMALSEGTGIAGLEGSLAPAGDLQRLERASHRRFEKLAQYILIRYGALRSE